LGAIRFSSGRKSQQGIKGINNDQSLLPIVRRDQHDRKARRIGERTCFWRSRLLFAEGGRPGHFFDFDFFTADFLAVEMTDFDGATVAQCKGN
jgi:hypothetical protein